MNIASAGGKYKSPFAFSTQNYGGYEGVLNNHVQHVHKVHNAESMIDNAPPTVYKPNKSTKKRPIKRKISKKRKEKLYRRIGHPDVSTLVTKKFRLPNTYPNGLPGSPQGKNVVSQMKMISPTKTNSKSTRKGRAFPFVEHVSGQTKNNSKLNLPEFIDYDEDIDLSSIQNYQMMEQMEDQETVMPTIINTSTTNKEETSSKMNGFSPFHIPDDLEITFGEYKAQEQGRSSRLSSAMSQAKPNDIKPKATRSRPASKASTRRTNSRASSALRRGRGVSGKSRSRPASRGAGRRQQNSTSFVFLNKQHDPNSPSPRDENPNQKSNQVPVGKQFWSRMGISPEQLNTQPPAKKTISKEMEQKLTNILFDEDDLRKSSSPKRLQEMRQQSSPSNKSPSKKNKRRRIYETRNGITKPIRKHDTKFTKVQSRYKNKSRHHSVQKIKLSNFDPATGQSPKTDSRYSSPKHRSSPNLHPSPKRHGSPNRYGSPKRQGKRAKSPLHSGPYSPPNYEKDNIVDHGITPFIDPYSYLKSNYYSRDESPPQSKKMTVGPSKIKSPHKFYDDEDDHAFDFLKPNEPISVDDQNDDDNISTASRPTSRSSNRPYSSKRPSSRISNRPGSSRISNRPGSRGSRHRRRTRVSNTREPQFFNDDMDDLMLMSEISKLDHVQEDAPRYMFPQMLDRIDPSTFTEKPVIAPAKPSGKSRKGSLQLAPLFV